MSREWQQTKMTDYLMPNAVYYQSLWAVRDLERMENRLEELSGNVVCDQNRGIMAYGRMQSHPMERDVLERRISEIHAALESIPMEYRFCILRNIILRESGEGYPDEWRYWKQRFLYNVAKNLALI